MISKVMGYSCVAISTLLAYYSFALFDLGNTYKPPFDREISLKDKKDYQFDYRQKYRGGYEALLLMLANNKMQAARQQCYDEKYYEKKRVPCDSDQLIQNSFTFKLRVKFYETDELITDKIITNQDLSFFSGNQGYLLARYSKGKKGLSKYRLMINVIEPEESKFYEKSRIAVVNTSESGPAVLQFICSVTVIGSCLFAVAGILFLRSARARSNSL